jgi:type II secretory ATPase GspE/PulE/Tfp pilus assembly ATPase PilB-like protein
MKKAGLTFSGALRSLLRQDPDIIMIGEIPRLRDRTHCRAGCA